MIGTLFVFRTVLCLWQLSNYFHFCYVSMYFNKKIDNYKFLKTWNHTFYFLCSSLEHLAHRFVHLRRSSNIGL